MLDIELLNYNPDTPSFYVILITALFAFFLSSLIAITYELTTKSIYKKAHFLQSLALIAIVAATVMQAIGDSLARGLGMLGALSIIRFRTVLDDPRNITFMFASLAAGIACGVLGFGIALTGTLVFCIAAVILRFSPMSNANELIGELKLQVPKNDEVQGLIEKRLTKHCTNYELDRLRFLNPKKVRSITEEGIPTIEEISRENLQEFTYLIRLRRSATVSGLTESMKGLEGLEGLRLVFQKQATKL
ncbi:MAG: DUF4956 domain-containing protein [Bacteroidota bacterium]